MSEDPTRPPSGRARLRLTKDGVVAQTESDRLASQFGLDPAPAGTPPVPATATPATPAAEPAAESSDPLVSGSAIFAFQKAIEDKPAEPAPRPSTHRILEGLADRPLQKDAAPRSTTRKFLEAMSSMLGTTPEDATQPTHPGAPALLESDPLTPERFKTKTKKLLGERLNRPSRKFTPQATDLVAPAITVQDLDAMYDERQVLFDLNFSVRKGEILAILGGSGSGKTTLLKHLIGLLRPSRGTIRISGQDIAKLEGDDLALVLKSIGMLFQYSALFNSMTIAENVALPLREYTDLPAAAIAAIVRLKLALVGLPAVGERLPSELSGGMKKRAALARALALDPDVLFFDEPGSGLDPIAAAALDELILHLNRSFGTTMVIVTHDLENAFNVAHRILMLDQGKIRMMGTPAEVKASADPWVSSFLHRSAALRDAVDEKFFATIGVAPRGKSA